MHFDHVLAENDFFKFCKWQLIESETNEISKDRE